MRTRQYPSIHENPHILRAVVTLRRLGWTNEEIMDALRFRRATLYKCYREIVERSERCDRD